MKYDFNFFHPEHKPKVHKKPRPRRPGKATNKRISGEDVRYYNPFKVRKRTNIVFPTTAKDKISHIYAKGFYSNGAYCIKADRPKLKKGNWFKEVDIDSLLLNRAIGELIPIQIVGEFIANFEGEVNAHAITEEGTELILNPEYIDAILTKYPAAESFIVEEEETSPIFFKVKDKIIVVIMPITIKDNFFEEIKNRVNEVCIEKGFSPTKLA